MEPGDYIPKPGPYRIDKGERVLPAAPRDGAAATLMVLIQSKGIDAVVREEIDRRL